MPDPSPQTVTLEVCALPSLALDATSQPTARWWEACAPATRHQIGKKFGITADLLRQVAQNFGDSRVSTPPIKTGHQDKGPSKGWIEAVRWDEERQRLDVLPGLNARGRAALEGDEYRHVSAEITLAHPFTGKPALVGISLQGAERPAVSPLRRIELSETTLTEDTMPDIPGAQPTPEQSSAPASGTPAPTPTPTLSTPPAQAAPSAGVLTLSEEQLAGLAAQLAPAVIAATSPMTAELNLAHQRVVEQRVTSDLDCCEGVPIALRQGLHPTLVALAQQTDEIQLSEGDNTRVTTAYAEVLKVLRGIPKPDLGTVDLSASWHLTPEAGDARSTFERRLHTQHGIDDDRRAELAQKYGGQL